MKEESLHQVLFMNRESAVFSAPSGVAPDTSLSAYVIEELPADLRVLTDEGLDYHMLAAKHRKVIEEVEKDVYWETNPKDAKKNQLDLLFLLGSYLPAKNEAFTAAPPELLGLLNYNKARFDISNRMNYDLIIDTNSAEFAATGLMRVYTESPSANHERDFYVGHFYAEPHVKAATFNIRSMIEVPEVADKYNSLLAASDHMEAFNEYMQAYARLPKDVFGYLRQFLDTYPDGTRNASGAFMPSVQLLELVLHKPTAEYSVFLDESMDYFPSWAVPIIKEQRSKSRDGLNVEDMLNSGELILSDEERTLLFKLVDSFIDFRSKHIGTTYKQVPGAFPEDKIISRRGLAKFGERNIMDYGEIRGTAGFNVQNVLGNSVFRLVELKKRLEGGVN